MALLFENETCCAFYDRNPVSDGHLLIIPKQHRVDYFALSQQEQDGLFELLAKAKEYLDKRYHPDGYNIGFNCGLAAGQTVFHCHCHLIPRYTGDLADPSGGVRGAIPHKRHYKV